MTSTPGSRSSTVSRREFVAAVSTFSVIPRHVLGGAGYTAPSEKVAIAFIGVGSQGLRVMLSFLKEPDVQAVAVCDPNRASADYAQWGESEFATAVHSLLGVSSGWEWLSPNRNVALRTGRELAWDRAGLKTVNDDAAQRLINPERRAGWAL